MIKIYDTLSGKKEPLPDQKKIRLFVCGPTVYDYLHIGNARTYIFFDFFAKYLRSQGYEVEYVQNITDIDDKIIKRAKEENEKPEAIAKKFTEAYLEDMKMLGINAVAHYAPATKFITQIVAQVERLIDKGFAYKIENDGWYFDISKDADYGKLSHRTSEQAEDSVSRIDESIGKKNKGDFCLWKFSEPNEPSWPAAIGNGRPGWHIEDTAISEFYFGPQYEIHGGGVDLKFPHHEAEIAQQESASGQKPFVQIWMHTGALLVEGKKMSKSLGNFITIRDFLKKYDANILRWIVLSHHYRSPIDFSDDSAKQAKATLLNIEIFLGKLRWLSKDIPLNEKEDSVFQAALQDDLNISIAIADMFDVIAEINPKIWNLSPNEAARRRDSITPFLKLMGFSFEIPRIPKNIEELAKKRELSRASKQFTESDRLRMEINSLGYEVEDTPKGPFIWPTVNS